MKTLTINSDIIIKDFVHGILATVNDDEQLLINDALVRMWGIPESLKQLSNSETILTFIASQLENSEVFLEQVNHLATQPDAILKESLQLSNGKWVTVDSKPQYLGTQIVGRTWYFYDFSAIALQAPTDQQKSQSLQLMIMIAESLQESVNLKAIFNQTLTELSRLLVADRVCLYQLSMTTDEQPLLISETVPHFADNYDELLQIYDHYLATNPSVLGFYRQGKIQTITNETNEPLSDADAQLLAKLQLQSHIAVPIVIHEELWGLLMIQYQQHTHKLSGIDSELLQGVTAQLAIAIQQWQLQKQLEIAQNKIASLNTLDDLTHIANRRYFDQYLEQEWQRMAREQQYLSVILCDIDYFAVYNHAYGYNAGDFCLQQLALALSLTCKRPADVVTRYRGGTYGIVLPHTNLQGTQAVAKQIQESIRQLEITHERSPIDQFLTLSLGCSSMIPTLELLPENFVALAEKALAEAKARGGNQVIFSDTDLLVA